MSDSKYVKDGMMEESNNPECDRASENQDYYFENGLLVFTEKYHLKRGFCCGNKCRHCPYNHKNVK